MKFELGEETQILNDAAKEYQKAYDKKGAIYQQFSRCFSWVGTKYAHLINVNGEFYKYKWNK